MTRAPLDRQSAGGTSDTDHRELLGRTLKELRSLRARVKELEQARNEPIAVVGMGCRLPGGAGDPESLWKLLRTGFDAVTDIPPDRWDVDAYYDPDPNAAGKMYVRSGAFLSHVDGFDPEFFGISPRETKNLSPQQRLLLEVAWEALENAGEIPGDLFGGATGVFVGQCGFDEGPWNTSGPRRPEEIDIYSLTGTTTSITANRLSYLLGVTGPSVTVDTACSSSLVALHLACQSLRLRECDRALAGGVHVMLSPSILVALCRLEALAPDGRCKTFDAAANGYGRGEGCGLVVLKRLSDATANGDRILAVIRGSAVNQDGPSGGLTVPSGPSQEAVIRLALKNAAIDPADVGYVEAHGTGTALGDPIEIGALRVVHAAHSAEHPLLVGSIKSNVGHLEAAAGIAGVLKVVLALQHETVPAHLHLEHPNPRIDWDSIAVEVPRETRPFPRGAGSGRPLAAGVSSFGLGGTNAHVILEQAPAPEPVEREAQGPGHVLVVSAATRGALGDALRRLDEFLEARPTEDLDAVCRTAATARTHFEHRAAVVAEGSAELRAGLGTLCRGEARTGALTGRVDLARRPEVAFLFTGQGSQVAGMGAELFRTQRTFRESLERCAGVLDPLLERPLLEVLFSADDPRASLDSTAFTQPALFAFEYALARMWNSWGIDFDVALGHSIGEYVAAHLAGVFELEDALRLVAARGRLMQSLPAGGGMAAIFGPRELVAATVRGREEQLSIAAINGPRHTVLSGERAALSDACAELQRQGIRSRELRVSHAFHSPSMAPIESEFARLVAAVRLSTPRKRVIANLTGRNAGEELATPAYWVRHMRNPVQFLQSVRTLLVGAQPRILLEVGPKPTLLAMARECVGEESDAVQWIPSLVPRRGEWEQVQESLAALHVHGAPVDWVRYHGRRNGALVALPTYPFQRRSFPFPVGGRRPSAGEEGFRDWLYSIDWRAGPSPTPRRDDLPEPAAIQAQVQREIQPLCADPALASYGRLLERLDGISAHFVARALAELGRPLVPGAELVGSSLAEELGVAAEHRRLFTRCLGMLEETGFLERSTEDAWRVSAGPPSVEPRALLAELAQEHPEGDAEITLLGRCAERLADVLRGDQDAVQLLFPEGDASTVTRLYLESPGFRVMNDLVRSCVRTALAGPAERRVRVLEVGAGTGSVTAELLGQLPAGRTNYVFTDVSTMFLHRAEERFRAHDFVDYRILDAERPAEEQGFDAGSFDVIVAANVLHATRDLRRTLEHVRRLLAPGGVLVLLEASTRQRWVDLTFGLTEGWWRFADHDVRADHPLLDADRWLELLAEVGFERACSVPAASDRRGLFAQHAVLVARRPFESAAPSPGRWLIFSDEEVGPELARLLEEDGRRCVLIHAREGTGERPPFDPLDGDFEGLLAQHAEQGIAGVVHLWGLEASTSADWTRETLEHAARLASGSALRLAQALAKTDPARPARLWIVTRGAAPVGGGELALAQTPLLGLGKAVALEHPERWGGLVDLDPGRDSRTSALSLLCEFLEPDGEELVALRDGERYVPRLTRSPDRGLAVQPIRCRTDASYLITGGLGGVGLVVAERLAQRGARHLVLLGRREPSPRTQAVLDRLRQQGCEVRAFQANVGSRDELAAVLAEVARSLPPLAGVVHSAGVVDDAMLLRQSWESFSRVFQAKVFGAWNLHLATRDLPLDFFFLFSTAAAVLGSSGQANHVAANTFVDALAHHRRALGLPAVSIDWGPWSEVGAATRGNVVELMDARGIGAMANAPALQALEWALASGRAQVVVVPVAWPAFLGRRPHGTSLRFFEDLAREAPSRPTIDAAAARADVGSWPAGERRERLCGLVAAEVARVLGFESVELVEEERGFFQLGMDSLTTVKLRGQLAARLGISLPATVVFDHPTVGRLAARLEQELFGASEPARRDERENDSPPADGGLGELSDPEVRAMLDEELDAIDELLS